MKNKNITVNFVYQLAYQILTIIMPIITAPYLSRILGSEGTGVYSFSYVVVSYFVILAALGIDSYGNRTIAAVKDKGQDELNYTFSSICYMHMIVSVFAIALYLIYLLFFLNENVTIAFLQLFFVIGALFDVNWFFFGIEEFKVTVTRNSIVKVMAVVAIFIFVRSADDLWKYTLIMSLGSFISQSIVWFFIPRYTKLVKVSIRDVFSHLKPLLILFIAVIATSLYRMIDKLMLGWAGDMSILGKYEYADRIIKMATTVITSLGTVMLPRVTALYAAGNDNKAKQYLSASARLVFFISFALAFGLAAISREFIVVFLGNDYEASIEILMILSMTIPIMGWNNLVRTQILMPKMKDGVYTRAVWIGAIVNVILNAVLIHLLSAIGAAIATVISYAIVGLFQTYPIRNEYSLIEYFKCALFPSISGIIMFFIVRLIGNRLGVGVFTVVVEIVLGAIIYILLNTIYLYKADKGLLMLVVNRLLRRLK